MESGRELLEHEMRDLYDVEHKQVNSLKTMANQVSEGTLREALLHHREETEGQIARLEEVFALLDRAPRREACPGINGLIEEHSKFMKEEDPSTEIADLFTTTAGVKAEHYEIVMYESLIRLAERLEMVDVADLLEQNLAEERATAERLEDMSQKLGSSLTG